MLRTWAASATLGAFVLVLFAGVAVVCSTLQGCSSGVDITAVTQAHYQPGGVGNGANDTDNWDVGILQDGGQPDR